MKLMHHWRLILLLLFALWAVFLIHPFSKQGVAISYVEYPATGKLRAGDIIEYFNGNQIKTVQDFADVAALIKPNDTVEISFLRETFPYTYANSKHIYVTEQKDNETHLGLFVKDNPPLNLKLNHELVGGNKFIFSSTNAKTDAKVLSQRMKFGQISDYSVMIDGDKIYLLTVAGKELERLVAIPGKFEAKIGNDTYFTAADAKQVCTSGVDCTLRTYQQLKQTAEGSQVVLRYDFEVRLGDEAGKRFAELTKNLSIGACEADVCYLNETIDYYVDGIKFGSEQILSSYKGEPYTTPLVGGETLTIRDAGENRFFLQAMLQGESGTKYEGMEKMAPSLNLPYSTILILIVVILAVNAAIVFVRIKNPITALFAFGLPGLELLTVTGILSGLNVMVTPVTMVAIIALPIISLVLYNYLVHKAKKEQLIKKKINDISNKWDWWLFIAIIVFFVLDLVYAKFFAPILTYVLILFMFSKTTFLRAIKTREY